MGVETALLFCAIRLTENWARFRLAVTRERDMKWRCVCGLKDTR